MCIGISESWIQRLLTRYDIFLSSEGSEYCNASEDSMDNNVDMATRRLSSFPENIKNSTDVLNLRKFISGVVLKCSIRTLSFMQSTILPCGNNFISCSYIEYSCIYSIIELLQLLLMTIEWIIIEINEIMPGKLWIWSNMLMSVHICPLECYMQTKGLDELLPFIMLVLVFSPTSSIHNFSLLLVFRLLWFVL